MKNPFMSIFLSNANRIANTARGHATVAVKREASKTTTKMTNAWTDAWTDAMFPTLAPKRRRKSRQK